MENIYKPSFRHYAIVGLSIPLIWAGLDSIAMHNPKEYEHRKPTCINPGKEGSLDSLKKKLDLDDEIEKEVFGE